LRANHHRLVRDEAGDGAHHWNELHLRELNCLVCLTELHTVAADGGHHVVFPLARALPVRDVLVSRPPAAFFFRDQIEQRRCQAQTLPITGIGDESVAKRNASCSFVLECFKAR